MSADQEIGQYPISLSPLRAIFAPDPARQKVCGTNEVVDANRVAVKKMVAIVVSRELDADLGIHDVGNNQRAMGSRVFYRSGRGVGKCVVGNEDVEKNV